MVTRPTVLKRRRGFVASCLWMPSTGEAGAASSTTAFELHPSAVGLAQRPATADSGASYLPEAVEHARPDSAAAQPAKAAPGGMAAAGTTRTHSDASEGDAASRFICHICLNSPERPVVTVCGHLYW
jgi:hypothetical protein